MNWRWRWRVREPAHLFLLIAPIIYAAFALLTPPFQAPDEHQHLFRAWQLSQLRLIGERRGNEAGGVLPESLGRAAKPELGSLEPHMLRRVVKRPFTDSFKPGTPITSDSPPRFYNFISSVIYSPVGYVPQVTAIWVGNALGSSVENIIRLGRLLNAALAIGLIYCSLRIAPVGRLALAWVGLLPMTAFISSSFGQDALIIGSACLLTALALRRMLGGKWTSKELFFSSFLAVVLSVSKFVYLPLAMIGGAPFVERRFDWRRLPAPLMIALFAGLLTIIWLRAVSGVTLAAGSVPAPHERLAIWVRNPAEPLLQLERTYVMHGRDVLMSLFSFGWLNVWGGRVVEYTSLVSACIVLLAGDRGATALGWQSRLWLLAIAGVIVLLISIALSLYFSPIDATWIVGVQGRYFIPIAPAVFVALSRPRSFEASYAWTIPLMLIVGNLFALKAIAESFYY